MLKHGVLLGRPISSCRRCRKFKVGCDRAKPRCSRCAKAKMECHYPSPPSSPSDASAPAEDADGSLRSRMPGDGYQGECVDAAASVTQLSGSTVHTGPTEPSLQNLSLYASSLRLGNVSPSAADVDGFGNKGAKLTRDRAILSCMRCRRHKVRCDRKIPCSRCIKNKRESQCVYSEAAPPLGRIISDKHHETLNLIATGFIDSKWDATVRNGTHWNSILYEVSENQALRL